MSNWGIQNVLPMNLEVASPVGFVSPQTRVAPPGPWPDVARTAPGPWIDSDPPRLVRGMMYGAALAIPFWLALFAILVP